MGDNIYLGDRNGVRTPMQWTPDRNGGFSRCDPARLYLPMIMDPVYGYEAVNVEAQSRSLASLLSWTKRLIAVRKSSKVFGRGSLDLHPAGQSLGAGLCAADTATKSCFASPTCRARRRRPRSISRRGAAACRSKCWAARNFPPIGELPYLITLAPYGFFWFRLCEPGRTASRQPVRRAGVRDTRRSATAGTRCCRAATARVSSMTCCRPILAGRRWFAERGAVDLGQAVGAPLPSQRRPRIALA